MKLIYISNSRIPTEKAHGIQIMKMCEAFSGVGLNVELIIPWRFNKIKKNPFEYYGVKKNFKIRKLPSLDLIPLGLPKVGFWIQNISFAISVFFYLLFKKAKIIYTRDFLSLFSSIFSKRNFIYEAHNFPNHFWIYQGVLKRIHGLVVITQKLKEIYQEKGIDPEKILVAPDGVDLKKFDILESQKICRQKMDLPLEKKIILYSGHLYKWKGVETLIKSAKLLNQNILIVIVGGTRADFKRIVLESQKSDNVLFLGNKKHLDIPYYLKAADVLVLPNSGKIDISRLYTSPLKLFEYMAAKKPIVASNLPSIREILNENNSILTEPDNPKDLAKNILKVLRNSNLSIKIYQQAYRDVQKYTWRKRVEKILEFIS